MMLQCKKTKRGYSCRKAGRPARSKKAGRKASSVGGKGVHSRAFPELASTINRVNRLKCTQEPVRQAAFSRLKTHISQAIELEVRAPGVSLGRRKQRIGQLIKLGKYIVNKAQPRCAPKVTGSAWRRTPMAKP